MIGNKRPVELIINNSVRIKFSSLSNAARFVKITSNSKSKNDTVKRSLCNCALGKNKKPYLGMFDCRYLTTR
jgi:hypothetical protein